MVRNLAISPSVEALQTSFSIWAKRESTYVIAT